MYQEQKGLCVEEVYFSLRFHPGSLIPTEDARSYPSFDVLPTSHEKEGQLCHLLFVNPIVLSELVLQDLLFSEPQRNFLLCTFDAVRAVADITSDIDGVIPADSSRLGLKGVGRSKNR